MKKTALLTMILLALAIVSASAQPPAMMGMGDKMATGDQLNLTDQQKESMQNLMLQHQKAMVQTKADLKLAQLELREIMMKTKVDEKAALNQVDKISKIKADIAKAKMQNRLAMRKVLTDEQLAKAVKMHGGPRGFEKHMMKFGRGEKGCCGGGEMGCGPGMGMGMEMGMPGCDMGGMKMGHGDKKEIRIIKMNDDEKEGEKEDK